MQPNPPPRITRPCPSREELSHYLQGRLPGRQLDEVAEHLAGCTRCENWLGELVDADDTVVSQLRRCVGEDPLVREPECAELEVRARAVRLDQLGDSAAGRSDETTEPEPDERFTPRPFGPYELLAKLGQGGMGVVYKARQLSLNRLVAIKMIRLGRYAGAQDRARFHTEGEAIARLRHANVVQIYECAEHDGVPYFSMELVEGGSLAQLLSAGPLPERAAAELIRTLGHAVHYAHRRGVIHRDLKPANVLIADCTFEMADFKSAISNLQSAIPKITDFGLAKLLDAEDGQTQSDAIMGTVAYMAPEQARGESKAIGPPADVYALGAILYELLAGRPPFRGATSAETLDQVRGREPVPPSRWHRGLAADLEAICLKCLEKDPARRYASAQELAEDLGRWLRGEPTRARPLHWLTLVGRLVCRHPLVSAAALLVAVAALGSGVAAHYLDPDRPTREIERELAHSRPVQLVGQTGPPRQFHWRAGQDASQASVGGDGTFAVHSWKVALVELLPDPQLKRYRFTAQVRHDTRADGGQVGIYFAQRDYTTPDRAAQFLCKVTFDDISDARRIPGLTGNQARLNPYVLYSVGGRPAGEHEIHGVESEPFAAAGLDGGHWHEIVVLVTPEGVHATWDGISFRSGLDAEYIPRRTQRVLSLPRRGLADDPFLQHLAPEYTPRGGLGLFVGKSSASFRGVSIEPLPGE